MINKYVDFLELQVYTFNISRTRRLYEEQMIPKSNLWEIKR